MRGLRERDSGTMATANGKLGEKKLDEKKRDEKLTVRVVDGATEALYRVRRRQPIGVIARNYAKRKGVGAISFEYNGQVLDPHQAADLPDGAILVRRRVSKGIFPDGVMLEILAYLERGAVGAMTSKEWYRVWTEDAEVRLRDRIEGTGVDLGVLSGLSGPGREAMFRSIASTSDLPPPPDKNSFDGLVFVLSLQVDGKDRVLRLLDKPSDVEYIENDFWYEEGSIPRQGVLHVTFDLDIPIPTKRLSTLSNDDDSFKTGKGAAQLFMENDVVKDELVMKISAFDRKMNRVARDVYLGAANERRVPCDDGDFWAMYWDDDHLRYGWIFEGDRTGSYDEKFDVRASLYFDAETSPGPIIDFDADDLLLQLRQWQPPIGTNFTTVELTFENIDDIAHLKSLLTWRPLMM